MKKFLAVLTALMIVLSLGTVFVSATETTDDSFIVSPPGSGSQTDGEIIITDYDDIGNADPAVDKDKFQDAHDELKNTDDLTDLNDEIKEGSVVRDLYDITATGDALDKFKEEGKVTVTIDAGLKDDNFQVIIRTEDGWVIVPAVRNPDGSITVTITSLGALAILTVPSGGGTIAPPTGDGFVGAVAAFAAVCLAGGAVLFRRKRLAK